MTPLRFTKGDATSPQAKGPKVLAHICNDVGGWGKGIVLAISRRWPEPERAFRQWHRDRAGNDFGLGAIQMPGRQLPAPVDGARPLARCQVEKVH